VVSVSRVLVFLLCAACGDAGPVRSVHRVRERRQIAAGRYSNLDILGSANEYAHVVATRDGSDLVVLPFEGGEGCTVGPAHWTNGVGVVEFSDPPFWAVVLRPMTPRLWYFDNPNEEGWGDLRLTDSRCHTDEPLVTDAVDWGWLGYLWRTRSRDVRRVDFLGGTSELVAVGVDDAVGGNLAGVWLAESGELVLLGGEAWDEIARFGYGVREAAVSMSFGGWAAFVDDDGLSLVDGTTLEVGAPIEADACEPAFLPELSLGATFLSYLSPCASRRLVLRVPGSDERVALGEGVTATRWLQGGWVFYAAGGEPGARVGEIWAVPPGATEAVRVGANGDLDAIDALEIFGGAPGEFLVEVDGGLGRWTPEAFVPLADGVAAHRTAIWSIVAPGWEVRARVAALVDFDGEVGRLVLVDPLGGETTEIASDVPLDGFRFTGAEAAIDFIDEWDGDGGRLRARQIATGTTETIDEDVSELREVLWPETGLLYTVTAADREGIWFVEMDRPEASIRVDG